jgi:hypothetical protein
MPSSEVILERAKSLSNEACFTVAMQHRRLRSTEPEDEKFIFRWWADLQFLIVALRRLRRSVQLIANVPRISEPIQPAIKEFDSALPGLVRIRNVGEHIEDYVLSRGHDASINRGQLQVGSWDGTV